MLYGKNPVKVGLVSHLSMITQWFEGRNGLSGISGRLAMDVHVRETWSVGFGGKVSVKSTRDTKRNKLSQCEVEGTVSVV